MQSHSQLCLRVTVHNHDTWLCDTDHGLQDKVTKRTRLDSADLGIDQEDCFGAMLFKNLDTGRQGTGIQDL